MMRMNRTFTMLTVLATCALAHAQPTGDSDRDALARQLHQKIEALQNARADRRRAEQVHAQQVESMQRQIDRLKEDLETVETARQASQDELDEVRARHESIRRSIEASRQWLTQAAKQTRPIVDAFSQRIDAGIPFEKQTRADKFAEAQGGLSSDDSARQAEALAGAYQAMGDELAVGRRIELANTPIFLDGGRQRVHAWRLRLGLAGELFIAEDGQTVGLSSPDADTAWNTNLDDAVKRAVDHVFKIAREKRPPAMIGVPLSPARGVVEPSVEQPGGGS